MRWIFPKDTSEQSALARALAGRHELPPVLASLLVRRGFGTEEEADLFLSPQLKRLSDPFTLPHLRQAVDQILAAVDAGRRIVLYGDYDVDGVTSLALLREVLGLYGVQAPCFLPSRMDEGYGLSPEGVARCLEEHRPDLLIAVDCGTSSHREITSLREAGVEVIVFDHHEAPSGQLPPCVVVNPKVGGDRSLEYLCSAGVVFKAAHGLLKTRPRPQYDLKNALDFVALGTVADLVPLIGENRILVRRGLVQIAQSPRPGVIALCRVAGLEGGIVRPNDVGFRLGPRLNAAGRLGTAQAALELLTTTDHRRAQALAEELNQQNSERRQVELETFQGAHALVEAGPLGASIVVAERGWHPGVIGIVASRIMRAFHRPTFIVALGEDGHGKGSGRSIEGLNLVGALQQCAGHLVKFGGHEMAAGLTLREDALAAFREAFERAARATLTDEQLQPAIRLDGEIALAEVHAGLGAQLERLQPFGMSNRTPVLAVRGVRCVGVPRTMKEKHLRFHVQQPGGRMCAPVSAVWFNAPAPLPPPPWDIAFQLEPNEWNGEITWQLNVEALRTAAP
ncbi:MAG: single-stranded-DNA-specific exonuclease RecJ [Verrucomicrobia bacterium]|nr:single-stranded-DNA-specific exonuclease RecJ [Verrucomicrobiota bacterium]